MPEDRKLLEPLFTPAIGLLRIVVGLLLITFALSLVNNDVPFWSGAGNCVTADWTAAGSPAIDTAFGTREGAHINAIPEYCAEHPTSGQRLLGLLGDLPSLLLLVGGLLLLSRLLRSAVKNGVYTTRTASKLRLLGWWVLIGSMVAGLAEATAHAALLATLTDDIPFSTETVLQASSLPYLQALTALGLLTFARITRAGAAMREDLEGTV
ncbi:hypothetical protein ACFXOS_24890 [Streptomyces sp. NPDC059175]|uniref:hypothetical protein n=1 Tax=Streptomyces sp. NPDC059175 TaxID=3346757 RepID=UPI00369BE09B